MRKNSRFRMVLLFLVASCTIPGWSQSIRIGTYNIRLQVASDTGNLWEQRKKAVADLIQFHEFDVIGLQEALPIQVADLADQLKSDMAYYSAGRDDGENNGEACAIFYNKSKFTLLAKGTFWLAANPDVPGKGWDARCCNRICSWVRLRMVASGKVVYFFNAHFDHEGAIARLESSKLVLQKMKQIARSMPAVFVGDLNCGAGTEPYLTLTNSEFLTDCYQQATVRYRNFGSFNGFGKQLSQSENIDHIFCTKHFKTVRWGLLPDIYGDFKFPSDHFPILAQLNYVY